MKFYSCIYIGIFVIFNGTYAFNSLENLSSDVANEQEVVENSDKLLSRRKRYLAFPEGASLTLAFCETVGFVGTPMSKWLTYQLDWGVVYDLPNETWVIHQRHYKQPKPTILRRNRRDLYGKLETIIESMGYDGRQCILRALCESKQYFNKKEPNMVEKLLSTVFSLPKSKVLPSEHEDAKEYDIAHRKGVILNKPCALAYPDCNLSLIRMALGGYSEPNTII
ncbi:hypothetical protein Bhyg_14489 [Pseudolycoriella hygida]|uniref:Uncharacterized protein n=1 Tax=Pseudolycoriella hygida TaxID=35572 RepID=A0A9Q0RXH2_9DIPT|nr:hypothetical protein Bhyg_14489 [Pseudolycoriella hygida]